MLSSQTYQWLADGLLLVHFAMVCFVLGGFVCILIRRRHPRHWVNNRWFRRSHLALVAVIALQALLGRLCPLTIWENALRSRAGQLPYEQSFIQHWLHELMYYTAPAWMFAVVYTLFALLVGFTFLHDRHRWQP